MSVMPVAFEPRRFRTAAAHYMAGRVPYSPRLIARVAMLSGLGADDRVLDLGCGPGPLARAFAPLAAEVVAVDPEPAMLALAAEEAPPNLRLVAGSSYDLGPEFGRFRLVTMGRSFHWMDRVDTLRRLDAMVEPDGVITLFADTHPDVPENAWRRELRALTARFVPEAERWRGTGWVRHEAVLLDSAFAEIEQIAVIERRRFPAERLVDRVFSMSTTSRARLGDRADGLAAEVATLASAAAVDGMLTETVSTVAMLARREGS